MSFNTGRGNSFSRSLYYAKKPPDFKLVQGVLGGTFAPYIFLIYIIEARAVVVDTAEPSPWPSVLLPAL